MVATERRSSWARPSRCSWRAVAADVGLGGGPRVRAGLHRVLLGGQPEGVEAHRVQHVVAGHPQVAAQDVRADEAQRVPDVQPRARGVGEHVQQVDLRRARCPARRGSGAWKVPSRVPPVLPAVLDVRGQRGVVAERRVGPPGPRAAPLDSAAPVSVLMRTHLGRTGRARRTTTPVPLQGQEGSPRRETLGSRPARLPKGAAPGPRRKGSAAGGTAAPGLTPRRTPRRRALVRAGSAHAVPGVSDGSFSRLCPDQPENRRRAQAAAGRRRQARWLVQASGGHVDGPRLTAAFVAAGTPVSARLLRLAEHPRGSPLGRHSSFSHPLL